MFEDRMLALRRAAAVALAMPMSMILKGEVLPAGSAQVSGAFRAGRDLCIERVRLTKGRRMRFSAIGRQLAQIG
jgi:hypothetical protein